MVLAEVERGQKVRILKIEDETIRAQAIRFGISSGSEVKCSEKIVAGPIIISKGKQEIAIGRKLAERITVVIV
ncbi:MAG: ferrous iron transport protein A [Negativicutes bacterium]|jgi:Fe2+ transport system protein FeoA|nr:ferrous iron transport protein A [Negativicutes bacterium]MBP9536657.1 ferrous iron transport protein A [Negativicutes bacterium]MBP9948492.1 ferrous iron transport protein A [Negativicutes bacterium]